MSALGWLVYGTDRSPLWPLVSAVWYSDQFASNRHLDVACRSKCRRVRRGGLDRTPIDQAEQSEQTAPPEPNFCPIRV